MSSGHDQDVYEGDEELAPWDSDRTGTIVVWAVLVAAAALLFPLALILWSNEILSTHTTRLAG